MRPWRLGIPKSETMINNVKYGDRDTKQERAVTDLISISASDFRLGSII